MPGLSLLADMWLNGAAVGIAFWICVMLICVLPSVAYYWQKAREAEAIAGLKQEMVARGYSVAEILAVVNNKPLPADKSDKPAKPHAKSPYEESHI